MSTDSPVDILTKRISQNLTSSGLVSEQSASEITDMLKTTAVNEGEWVAYFKKEKSNESAEPTV